MMILSILENIMYYAMLFKDTVTAATQKAPGPNSRGVLLLVIPARIELATYRLGGGCSILLSYGTITTAQAELKPFRPSCTKYYTAKTKYWQ